jgi:hypothetical protein
MSVLGGVVVTAPPPRTPAPAHPPPSSVHLAQRDAHHTAAWLRLLCAARLIFFVRPQPTVLFTTSMAHARLLIAACVATAASGASSKKQMLQAFLPCVLSPHGPAMLGPECVRYRRSRERSAADGEGNELLLAMLPDLHLMLHAMADRDS